jgi:PKD repeat protein
MTNGLLRRAAMVLVLLLSARPALGDTFEFVGWGLNESGQLTPPPGLTNIVSLAAGGHFTVALKSDGTVATWGTNMYGETAMPSGLSDITAIATGGNHTLALKGDGTVVAWGLNSFGGTNVPGGLTGVVAVAGGGYHSVALKDDGTLVAWGDNRYGQATVPAGLSNVTAIAAGGWHTLALKKDGTLVVWGDNRFGQMNMPAGLSDVTAIAGGIFHTLALKKDGTVVAWGTNDYGEGTSPSGLSSAKAIAVGWYHNVALRSDGTVVAWGYDAFGQATVPTGLSGVTAIAAGGYHTVALKALTRTLSTSWTGQGLVTSSPAGIDCGTTCQAEFAAGSQVTLTATPATGYSFSRWSGACTGTESCLVAMDAAKSAEAIFLPENHPPVASPTGTPNTGSAPLLVQFTANASDPDNDPITYSWNFGDGGTSNVANVSHTYFAADTYTASLTVSDGKGGSSSYSLTITVNSAIMLSVRTASITYLDRQKAKGLVTLWTDLNVSQPLPDQVISASMDGVPLFALPFRSFKNEQLTGGYSYLGNGILVRLDLKNHQLQVITPKVTVSGIDNSNGVDVRVMVGSAMAVQNIKMKSAPLNTLVYLRP